MNVVCMVGILPRDPENKSYGEEGKSLTSFSIGVKRGFNAIDWFECVAFGKTGENISKFFHKGDSIAIEGSLRKSGYKNKEGKTVERYSIQVGGFTFASRKTKSDDEPAPAPTEVDIPTEDVDDNDLPF